MKCKNNRHVFLQVGVPTYIQISCPNHKQFPLVYFIVNIFRMMFTLFLCLLSWQSANCMYTEKDGRRFMKDLNHLFAKESNKMGLLDWQFECDMTDENEEKVVSSYHYSLTSLPAHD